MPYESNVNPEDFMCMRMNEKPTPLDAKYNGQWPKIVCYGDSMTRYGCCYNAGPYVAMLQHKVGDYFDVDMRGISGYSSREALQHMEQLFPANYLKKVDVFVEFYGHNDSWVNYPFTRSIEEFESNTEKIFQYLIDNGLKREQIITVTPCWYDPRIDPLVTEEWKLSDRSKNFGKTYETGRLYNAAKLRVAKKMDITCIDMFAITCANNPDVFFFDGIHISPMGADLFVDDHLFPAIDEKVKKIHGKPISQLFHCLPVENLDIFQKWSDYSGYKAKLHSRQP